MAILKSFQLKVVVRFFANARLNAIYSSNVHRHFFSMSLSKFWTSKPFSHSFYYLNIWHHYGGIMGRSWTYFSFRTHHRHFTLLAVLNFFVNVSIKYEKKYEWAFIIRCGLSESFQFLIQCHNVRALDNVDIFESFKNLSLYVHKDFPVLIIIVLKILMCKFMDRYLSTIFIKWAILNAREIIGNISVSLIFTRYYSDFIMY